MQTALSACIALLSVLMAIGLFYVLAIGEVNAAYGLTLAQSRAMIYFIAYLFAFVSIVFVYVALVERK